MLNPCLVSQYIKAKNSLMDAIRDEFPMGSFVAVMKFEIPDDYTGFDRMELACVPAKVRFVGKVHCYCESPLEINLLLEHGQVRTQSVGSLVKADAPYWARC